MSSFPNWKAEGADGPFHAAPNHMVVIPTAAEVSLHFRTTWVEWTGLVLTLLGLVLVTVPQARRRLAGPTEETAPAEPTG